MILFSCAIRIEEKELVYDSGKSVTRASKAAAAAYHKPKVSKVRVEYHQPLFDLGVTLQHSVVPSFFSQRWKITSNIFTLISVANKQIEEGKQAHCCRKLWGL